MLKNVFHPLNEQFLTGHNDACITNYWTNWDLCAVASVMAIGILCDDAVLYDRSVDYFKTGAGNGSIKNAVPFVYSGADAGLAQWQESGRDQGHTLMGMGRMGAICEMAWSQGDDLYGYDGNRFMKAAQYVATYNLGQDVPFTTYAWGSGQNCAPNEQTVISAASHGDARPVWDLLHCHYARRRGLSVPYITALAEKGRPEGGAVTTDRTAAASTNWASGHCCTRNECPARQPPIASKPTVRVAGPGSRRWTGRTPGPQEALPMPCCARSTLTYSASRGARSVG